jgi:hypothetical protein
MVVEIDVTRAISLRAKTRGNGSVLCLEQPAIIRRENDHSVIYDAKELFWLLEESIKIHSPFATAPQTRTHFTVEDVDGVIFTRNPSTEDVLNRLKAHKQVSESRV